MAEHKTELVGIAHVGGEGPTDISIHNNLPSGFPDHLAPSSWKKVRFVFHRFGDMYHNVGDFEDSNQIECLGYKWSLELFPGGCDIQHKGYVSIFLVCHGVAPGQEVHTNLCFRLGSDQSYQSIHVRGVFTNEDDRWGNCRAIGREDLLREDTYEGPDLWKDILEDDGSFIIDVDIQVGIPRSYKPANTIKADMVKVLDKACGENSDVVFQVGERTFHCFSGLLQVRAPELYSLVSEYDDRTPIPILEVSPDTFQLLMLTVYGGELPEDKKSVEVLKPLISAADRFGCTNSKLLAEEDLVSSKSISIDNVAELLLFADGANCALLKEAAISYFLTNLENVRKPEGYSKLRESPHVLEEIMIEAAKESRKRPASPDLDERDPNAKRLCVAALRSELNDKGLDVDGSREMLVSRLEDANAAAAAAAAAEAEAEENADGDGTIEVE